MLAILLNFAEDTIELTDVLQAYQTCSDSLQQAVRYESEGELLTALSCGSYSGVILEDVGNPAAVIPKIQAVCPCCRIAVVTNHDDPVRDGEMVAIYRLLGVDITLSRNAVERMLQ